MTRKGLLLAAAILLVAPPAGAQKPIKCRLQYSLEGWAIFYKKSEGTGTITCSNGQSASVRIETHAGGPTFGRFKIFDGHGAFSPVRDIEELYGAYAEVDAHAGVGASGDARALTKGDVSLALAGTGQGLNVGVAIGSFEIEPR